MATSLLFGGLITTSGGVPSSAAVIGSGFEVNKADLTFILQQIRIAENNVVARRSNPTDPCAGLVGLGANQIPEVRLPFGLRTVDGTCNHLEPGTQRYGAADTNFVRMTAPMFITADQFDPDGAGPVPPVPGTTTYNSTAGVVADVDPRLISNLIVDQTDANPAAVAASDGCAEREGADLDGDLQPDTCFTGNVAPDAGLSAPFNSMFTFFGQFFDHGLDLVNKGGSGSVFVPLLPDDPLYNDDLDGPDDDFGANCGGPGATAACNDNAFNFLTLSRGTNVGGNLVNDNNQTTSYVDQNQTYTSHPSHQVFLRDYDLVNLPGDAFAGAVPVSSGILLDGTIEGNIANWGEVKAQAAAILGIVLEDTDVGNVPVLMTDAYGQFVPGPARGMPQIMTTTGPIETNIPAIALPANTIRTNHAFLDDIAHNAAPSDRSGPLDPDGNSTIDPIFEDGGVIPALPAAGEYDDELLDAHFVTGDGRGNENIGLTAVHTIFHSEHNRLAEEIDALIQALPVDDPLRLGFEAYSAAPGGSGWWYGDRLFQAARFVTEMQYQHLVFEEFARSLAPSINVFIGDGINFQSQVDPGISAEFAHAVYRFGHSMLNASVARTNPETGDTYDMTLFEAFLNPTAFNDNPASTTPWTASEAAGAIFQGGSRQVGNEIDEFVTDTLRNQLLGRPLDLATLNIARGRSEGVAPLNVVRQQLFTTFGHSSLAPYGNWDDFMVGLRNPESIVNFVAAYGTHPDITAETTVERRRAVGDAIINGVPFAGALTNPNHPDGLGDNPNTFAGGDESVDDVAATPGNPGLLTNPNDPNGFGDNPNTFPGADESVDDIAATPGDPGFLTNPNDPDGFGDDPATIDDESADDIAPTPADPGTLINDNAVDLMGDDPDTTNGGDESLDDIAPTPANPGTLINNDAPNLMGDDPDTTNGGDESLDDILPPLDADDFYFGTGAWANQETGLNTIDLWMGGLAERPAPFGGMLGSTFNWIFEIQLENLQNADRFYYLERLDGLNLLAQLEGNSFAEIIMRNTNARAFSGVVFSRPGLVYTINGPGDVTDETGASAGPPDVSFLTGNRIRYNGTEHVIWDGSESNDHVISNEGDDTFWGRGGNDRFEGSYGNDQPLGGEGDDIITDIFGDDVIKGGPGHDVITGGPGLDLLQGNGGDDFIVAGNDFTESFGGEGDDVMYTGDSATEAFAGDGNDWMEGGGQLDLLVGDENNQFQDDPNGGHDVISGGPGDDDYDSEGGDDIMIADVLGTERLEGMLGFDWVTYRGDFRRVDADMRIPLALPPQVIELRDRFDKTEALSGWNQNDTLRGDDRGCPPQDAAAGLCLVDPLAEGTVVGHELTQAGIDRILNLRAMLGIAVGPEVNNTNYTFDDGNILLGGAGSDVIEGRGGNDVIDGDRWLNAQLVAGGNRYDSLKQFQSLVVSGAINPGTINIERSIVTPTVGAKDCDSTTPVNCDTAVFTGSPLEYVFAPADANGVIRVSHIPDPLAPTAIGPDGVDALLNIERYMYLNNTPEDPADDIVIDPDVIVDFDVLEGATVLFENGALVPGSTIDFGSIVADGVLRTRTVTVVNNGTANLSIASVTLAVEPPAPDHPPFPFSIVTNNCTAAIVPAGSCTVVVGFTVSAEVPPAPETADAYETVLSITPQGAFPAAIPVAGAAVDNTPATGAPDVVLAAGATGFTVGESVTIDPAGIVDPDGVPAAPADFTVEWIAGVSTVLGAGSTFVLPASARGSQIFARVTFTDGIGAAEGPLDSPLSPVVGASITGTTNADTITAASATVAFRTTAGDDFVNALAGADTVDTGGGDDTVLGAGGADGITLGAGNDTATGGVGDDTINGQGGDDTFIFTGTNGGFDAITGGAGVDTIEARGTGPTTIGLSSLATVEAITGAVASIPVTILGSAAANTFDFRGVTLTNIDAIDGGGGADNITGSAGDDVIIGGLGNDTLTGFDGNDDFRFGFAGELFGTDTIGRGFDAAPAGGQDTIVLPTDTNITIAGANGGRDTRITVRTGTTPNSGTVLGTITILRVAPAAISVAGGDIVFV